MHRDLLEIKTGGFLSKTTEVKLDKALGTIKVVSAPGGKQLQMQFEGSVEPTNIPVANAEKLEAAIKSALAVSGNLWKRQSRFCTYLFYRICWYPFIIAFF